MHARGTFFKAALILLLCTSQSAEAARSGGGNVRGSSIHRASGSLSAAPAIFNMSCATCDASTVTCGVTYSNAPCNTCTVVGTQYDASQCPAAEASTECGLPVQVCGTTCPGFDGNLPWTRNTDAGSCESRRSEFECGQTVTDTCNNNCPNTYRGSDPWVRDTNAGSCESRRSEFECGLTVTDTCGNNCPSTYKGSDPWVRNTASGSCEARRSAFVCGQTVTDTCGNSCPSSYRGSIANSTECSAKAPKVACGGNVYDSCQNLCTEKGTYNCCDSTCPASSTVACGVAYNNGCGNYCGVGTGPNSNQCTAARAATFACGAQVTDNCGNACPGLFGTSGCCSPDCSAAKYAQYCTNSRVPDGCSGYCGGNGTSTKPNAPTRVVDFWTSVAQGKNASDNGVACTASSTVTYWSINKVYAVYDDGSYYEGSIMAPDCAPTGRYFWWRPPNNSNGLSHYVLSVCEKDDSCNMMNCSSNHRFRVRKIPVSGWAHGDNFPNHPNWPNPPHEYGHEFAGDNDWDACGYCSMAP